MNKASLKAPGFDKVFVILVLALFCLSLYRCSFHFPERELIRQQFHLYQETTFERLHFFGKNKLVAPPSIEAIIRFSDDQFAAYVENLDNPEIWKAIPISYYKTDWLGNYTTTFFGDASKNAYQWRDFSRIDAGAWGSVSANAIQEIRNGKMFCLSWQQPKNSNTYKAAHCHEAASVFEKQIYVKGVLDYDSRLLHVYIHGTGAK